MWKILQGDAGLLLPTLEKKSVQSCVTSPPYWQLRDYGGHSALGHEATPDEFVNALVALFGGMKEVLRDDGTFWLNMGDTYCGGGGYCPNAPSNKAGSKQSTNRGVKAKPRPVPPGYKKKDLVGIPWLLAHALRRDGWFLRADVIWDKTNAMPEKITDRPARTHEYLFLFSKSAKYYYNHEAVKEAAVDGGLRNLRSVWRIPQQPFAGAHFAVFPELLVKTCLKASTKEGDLVLDPFTGSGTTGVVAVKNHRDFIGLEVNPAYCQMAEERIKTEGGSLPPPSVFQINSNAFENSAPTTQTSPS